MLSTSHIRTSTYEVHHSHTPDAPPRRTTVISEESSMEGKGKRRVQQKFIAFYKHEGSASCKIFSHKLEISRCSPWAASPWFEMKIILEFRQLQYVEADPSQLHNFVLRSLNILWLSSMVPQIIQDQAWHANHTFDKSSKRRQFENPLGPKSTFFWFSGMQSQILRFTNMEILTWTMSRFWGFEECRIRGFLFLNISRCDCSGLRMTVGIEEFGVEELKHGTGTRKLNLQVVKKSRRKNRNEMRMQEQEKNSSPSLCFPSSAPLSSSLLRSSKRWLHTSLTLHFKKLHH